MNVAIIPARGGSKRIPNKNVRPFAGRPMISYPILEAKKSGLFDRIIVSTDSDEIARVASEAGAEVPFRRPPHLSDDLTPTAPVVEHAIQCLREQGHKPELVCCIYATTPFLSAKYLKEGFEKIRDHKGDTAFSVTSFPAPIFRALKINAEGYIEMFWPEHELTRSNDLPAAYHDAGQFYWLNTQAFLASKRLWMKKSIPIPLPRSLVQDIDTPEDWEVAEKLFEAAKFRGEAK